MQSVPITRHFTALPSPYQNEDVPLEDMWPSFSHGGRKRWDTLLEEYRVVILADAGAGKTHELRTTAERLVDANKPAFFLRLEDLGSNFSQAFEIGTAESFDRWLAGTSEAWFFLDSVDELRLSEPRAFEAAIRLFAARLQGALQRAHIYITSRPYAWRASLDRALITEIFPHQPLLEQGLGSVEDDQLDSAEGLTGGAVAPVERAPASRSDGNEDEISDDADGSRSGLSVYLLAPLNDIDIRQFAAASGITDRDAFLAALEHRNLLPLARAPFDLGDLIATWKANGALGNRLEVLQGSVSRLLAANFSDADREAAHAAVRLLAVAASLTGLSSIRLPGVGSVQAIDAEPLLVGWNTRRIEQLLTSGVFGDPIFGEVRFRHREVRDLLAAEWAETVFGRSAGRAEIERLIYAAPYGVDILTPRLRPLLPWLIVFDAVVRDRVLTAHPAVAIEGGDPASLPLAPRQALLSTLMEHVVDPASLLRGLDNAAIARIAQADLEDFVLALVEKYLANDDAIFVLGRLVWQGRLAACLPPLIEVATDSDRGIYARLVSIRAVMTIGTRDQIHLLWDAINTGSSAIPRRLLAELAENAAVENQTVALLLASIERLEPHQQFEATGLTQAINRFVEHAEVDGMDESGGALGLLIKGLQSLFEQPPYVERGECHVSKEYQWLMSPALHVVERLIEARSPAALSADSLAILAGVPALRFWRQDDYQDRKSKVDVLVPGWLELNDALFWHTVDAYRAAKQASGGQLTDDWPITFIGHFWSFDAASFARTLAWVTTRDDGDDKLVALARSFTTFAQNERPDAWLTAMRDAVAGDASLGAALAIKLDPPESETFREHRKWERNHKRELAKRDRRDKRDKGTFVAEITANPAMVRNPPGVKRGQFARIHYNLLREIEGEGLRQNRAQGADWQALVPQYGREVAKAYRDAAIAYWRGYKPGLRSEGNDINQIPYALIFAMAGLDIELSRMGAAAALTAAHARRAFRYVMWELNGFPRWFEALYRARPRIGFDFLWAEILWELRNTPPNETLHYALSDLVYYAPWLHREFGDALLNWLRSNQAPSLTTLRHVRTIIMSGKGASDADVALLARQKLGDPETPDDQRPTWYAMWVDSEPGAAIASLGDLFRAGTLADHLQFAMAFIVALLGGRDDGSAANGFGNYKSPTYLKQLYLMMHHEIPVENDLRRAGTGVFSPILRDDAKDARERLFELLNEISGAVSYDAILELAVTHPVVRYRMSMAAAAYAHAVADGDIAAWKPGEVVAFARRIEALPVLTGGASAAD